VRTPKLQAKVLAAIKPRTQDGSTHWSCRKLASSFQLAYTPFNGFWRKPMCARIDWNVTMASNEPDLE